MVTDVKPNEQNPFTQLLDSVNRSTGEITSSFFIKKNYPIRQKSYKIQKNPTHPNSNKITSNTAKILQNPKNPTHPNSNKNNIQYGKLHRRLKLPLYKKTFPI
jgi:hypothetical protein